MKILVIGSGGREHALIWKIAQSSRVDRVYAVPGNGGIAEIAECVNIGTENVQALKDFVKKERIDITVVGPEAPLVEGLVDEFEREGLAVFGPQKKAALIEGSKVFSKELMVRYGAPTAEGRIFDNSGEAQA